MPIDFKALETLVWVATLKSFGGAAAKLATTQPAVSQRIAQLEAELGVKLFERAPRRVALTAAGREALAHAERLIAGRAEMIARIADPATTRGVLRLGVAETIVHTWLPDFLAEMARALPRVGLEIEVDTSPALRERLLAQAIDLAFLVGPLSVPEISNAALSSERLAFVASPALGLGRRVDLGRCGHPILTFARNTRPYADLRAAAAAAGIDGLRIHASTSVATIVRMALDGLGLALLPASIVVRELGAGTLVELDAGIALPPLGFVAAWRRQPDEGLVRLAVPIAERVAGPRVFVPRRGTP